jgi:hypothetical protein
MHNNTMPFLSLEPFVPSGADFNKAKNFFLALGFTINWDVGDYIGFQKNECRFILQHYDKKEFAENFMISVKVADIDAFELELQHKQIAENFGVKISKILQQPYGRELNIIDPAGVCWHFVAQ